MLYCWAYGQNNRPTAEPRTTRKKLHFANEYIITYQTDIVCNTCLCYSDKRDFRQWCMVQFTEQGSSLWFSFANVFIYSREW